MSMSRRRQWHPTPVLLPGNSHGQRSLVGCSPWGLEESDTTEQLHFHFSLSCIGEGNGNPLQCSCLENPRDGGAWWAAVYRVAQSRTRLKRLSSSSSSSSKAGSFPKLFPKRQKGGELLEKKKIKGISQLSLVSRSKKSDNFACCHYLFFSWLSNSLWTNINIVGGEKFFSSASIKFSN